MRPPSSPPSPPPSPPLSARPPAAVWLAAGGWLLTAATLLALAVAPAASPRREPDASGRFGDTVVLSDASTWPVVVPVLGVLAVVLLTVALVVGLRWAVPVLVGLSLVAVLATALAGQVAALGLMAGLVLGTAPLVLSGRALDHLGVGA